MAWVMTSMRRQRSSRAGGHGVVGVDDSHVRGAARVVGERPLDTGLLIGDDGERRALGPVPGGGRDGDEGKPSCPSQGKVKIRLRMSMKSMAMSSNLHSGCSYIIHMIFAGVHSGATADGDDDVRLKESHLLGTATSHSQRRIRARRRRSSRGQCPSRRA